MNAYIYAADFYCDACGENIRADITAAGRAPANPDNESSYDSDQFPKGPYSDGGGESDYPCHCAGCNAFLDNPLTPDGVAYVRAAFADDRDWRSGAPLEAGSILEQWRNAWPDIWAEHVEDVAN